MKTTWLFAFSIMSISAAQIGCGSSDSDAGGGAGTAGSSAGTAGSSAGTAGSSAGNSGNPGGSGASDFPAIAPGADIRMLSDADKAKLCDWVSGKLGGYGLMTQCSPAVSVSNYKDQATCVANFYKVQCPLKASDVQACTLEEAPMHGCNTSFDSCKPLYCM